VTTFDELVGGEPTGEERARLRNVHDLLVEAGPPPEIPPEFAAGPTLAMTLGRLGRARRSRRLLMPAIAAAAVLALVVAIATGRQGNGVLALHLKGTAAAPFATGTLDLLAPSAKKPPMRIDVKGLPVDHYTVWLIRSGHHWAKCGEFTVKNGAAETVAKLKSPYRLEARDSWIVTRPAGNKGPAVTVLQPVTA